MASIKQVIQKLNRPQRAAYLFIAPALILLFVFTIVPLLSTLVISVLNMDVFLKVSGFASFEHFKRIWEDDRFWNALRNTFYFAAVEVPIQVTLALLVAVFVSKNTAFRKFLRSAFFLPSICSFTAIGIVWSFLLDPQTGMYPYYLSVLGLPRLEFLRDPVLAMPSVIVMTVWKSFGYTMVILVAGLQGIPQSYYEAAELDGAGKARQFFSITVPNLIPSLSFCIITTTIAALQVFDQIFVTTQGGPLFKTETLVAYIYNVGFKMAPYDLGYASAISVTLFTMIMVIALVMNQYFMKKETSDVQ